MVDTLADWMLRFPTLFHWLEIAAQVMVCTFFIAGIVFMVVLPGKKNEHTFPSKSKARLRWRVSWLLSLPMMADLVLEIHNKRQVPSTFAWVMIVTFYLFLIYANILGARHYKEWKRTQPPE